MPLKIRRDDTVMVIAGEDKGKTGRVLQVLGEKNRVIVEGVNLVKKALRKSQDNPQGGFTKKEAALHISNVLLYCPESKKGVRVMVDHSSGKRVRKDRKSNHIFD